MNEIDEITVDSAAAASAAARSVSIWVLLCRNPSVVIGGAIIVSMILISLLAPWLGTTDPSYIDPSYRNKKPGAHKVDIDASGTEIILVYRLGTDTLGRDIYSRVLFGARISLIVGFTVSTITLVIGLAIGLVSGYLLWVDRIVMRLMDGLMAIPGILLAIALVSLWGSGLGTVIIAITIPQIPRVVRLVRSIVLTIREEPYVESAISVGTSLPMILIRHVMPNTIAPLIVQGTYVCAAAIILEAILSFLGVGIPPQTPTWGNIIAEGRMLFRIYPHNMLYPGLCLALTVFAVNMLGDGLRDTLDPRLAKRLRA